MADIKHVFVLALENRSFDHIFGFSGLSGVDAVTGQPTKAEDLVGQTFENASGDGRHRFEAKTGGGFTIPGRAGEGDFTGDPSHEFLDVLRQISGPERVPRNGKLPNAEYPPISMNGFVADYQIAQPPFNPQIVMDSQDSNNLPILNQLAAEFMVCDHWFSALPGPTWPNRFFIHAASATGETDSASGGRIALAWFGVDKYTFHHGTIYDALAKKKHSHQIYTENTFSQVVCIGNQTVDMNIKGLESFEKDISDPKFPHSYVFIEPNSGQSESFGPLIHLGGGTENDMHPPSDIRNGEALVKRVFEGLRNSPLWETSVLVVMFDEHGGFFDHVPPPKVRPLDDGSVDHKHGFRYDQLGVRVPALIISPWVKPNSIDHTVYEHSSLIASVVRLFGLDPLTSRDREAADFLSKLSEKEPRKDAPARLHNTLDDANVAKVNLPGSLAPGQTIEMTITYNNIGATVWSKERGYKLVDLQPVRPLQQETGRGIQFPWGAAGQSAKDQSRGGDQHDITVTPASIDLPQDVRPGESVTFKTTIKAPANAQGCLLFQWGMMREGFHHFGQRTSPGAVFFGTSQPQLETAQLSFHQGSDGRDHDTLVEASLHDELTGLVASWKFNGQPFADNSVTNWFPMLPNEKFGGFAECQPRFTSIRITPNGHDTWIFVMYLMLNWTGGCSLFIWDMILSEKADERQRDLPMGTPVVLIAFKAPAAKGAPVKTMTKLTVEANLTAQLAGIEFTMEYVTVAGKRAWFTIGTGERAPDDTFELVWDMSKKLPADRDRTALDVTLAATAMVAPGSKLWEGRSTPRALLPVHLEILI
jgi:phospholipase C